MKPERQSTIYWNDAKEIEPVDLQTILVVYDGGVWPGVYANGKVTLYPEDFGSVSLSDCEIWAALPAVIESLISGYV